MKVLFSCSEKSERRHLAGLPQLIDEGVEISTRAEGLALDGMEELALQDLNRALLSARIAVEGNKWSGAGDITIKLSERIEDAKLILPAPDASDTSTDS